jgi:putative transposase
MPGRLTPLVEGEIYHIFNRGISHQPLFTGNREYQRALNGMCFYSFSSLPLKFSYFLKLSGEKRKKIINKLSQGKKLAEMICFCLMPNHFHFLLKQTAKDGIAKFMSNFQNSFTRYFNTRHKRIGPLFQGPFKAVRIETDDQLLHLSRYIHLNPYSSYVVKNIKDLEKYQWSSFLEYLGKREGFCQKETVLSFYRELKDYQKFVYGQAEYQRELQKIKHLIFEEGL